MTYQPSPIKTEGGQKEERTSDDNTQILLKAILKQLKIMNLHLSMMSDVHIRATEVG